MPTTNRPTLSRRGFLGASAATAVALPMFVPSRAFGANERITMGVIGVGKMASGHLDYFAGRKDVQVLAVSDVEQSRLDAAQKMATDKNAKLGRTGAKVDAYAQYEELLGRKDIDAVVIGSPDHWHTAMLIRACQAGKDIYCEKPLTLTIEESQLCIEAVRRYKRVMQTGSQQRSEMAEGRADLPHLKGVSRFRAAAEYIRNGKLGKIREIHVKIGQTSKPCDLPEETLAPGLDWDRWLGQAPKRPFNSMLCRRGLPNSYPFNPGWRDYREYSGGHVTDWGAHHFDIVQWALGMDGSGPSIFMPPTGGGPSFSKGGASFIYPTTPVGDNVLVKHMTDGNGIYFLGEKGSLWVNRGELKTDPAEVLAQPLASSDTRLEDSGGNHRQNWVDCIKSRKDPICRVEVGAGSVTVCHLVNLCYWHGEKLEWDPKTWSFKNPAHNAWKSREQRAPYTLPKV